MEESKELVGRTVIVTGATSGIGKETAKALARRGARVVLPCRSLERGEAAREDIACDTGNEDVVVMLMDLSSLQSVRDFAADFNAKESRLDILVNNAGVLSKERKLTMDGVELMFATNHLGHFLLTSLLLQKLEDCAPSRVVNVASDAMRKASLDFDDLQSSVFTAFKAYGRSKAANVMFTVQLAKLLKAEGSGVTCYSLHPGIIRTELARDYAWADTCCVLCMATCFVRCFLCQTFLAPPDGAKTTLHCCLSPSVAASSGMYYSNEREKSTPSHVTDPERVQRLWDESCKLVGLDNSDWTLGLSPRH